MEPSATLDPSMALDLQGRVLSTRIFRAFCARKDTLMLELFPIPFQIALVQIVFLKEAQPMCDHISFFQEVPRDLQYDSNLLVFVMEEF